MKKIKLAGLEGKHIAWHTAGNWAVTDGTYAPLYGITYIPTGQLFLTVAGMDSAKRLCDICAAPSDERETSPRWAFEKLVAARSAGVHALLATMTHARPLDMPQALAYVSKLMDNQEAAHAD